MSIIKMYQKCYMYIYTPIYRMVHFNPIGYLKILTFKIKMFQTNCSVIKGKENSDFG